MSGWKRFVFATDSHGDRIDRDCEREFLRFVRDWQPHLKIHGGDAMDLRPWRKGASREEQLEHIHEDLAAFERFMTDYQPDIWLAGNHDYRLWEEQHSANADRAQLCYKIAAEIETELLPKIKCQLIPYDSRQGIYQLGDVRLIHGYKHGMYPAKAHCLHYGSCIHGHNHTYQVYIHDHIDEVRAMSAPMLCVQDMPYQDKQVAKLKHRQGWLYGVWHPRTGKWDAWPVLRAECGTFLNPLKLMKS